MFYCSKSCRAKDTGVGHGVKTGKWVECEICKKPVWRKGYLLRKFTVFFCSRNCKGKTTFITRKGIPRPWTMGEKNHEWKGDKVGYGALHDWVYRKLGKPKKCMNCNNTENLEWANKSRKYMRDLTDWISLCRSCHAKYDDIAKNRSRDLKGRFIG